MHAMVGSAFWKDAGRLREGVLNPAASAVQALAHQSYLRMPDSAPQSATSALNLMEKIGVDIFEVAVTSSNRSKRQPRPAPASRNFLRFAGGIPSSDRTCARASQESSGYGPWPSHPACGDTPDLQLWQNHSARFPNTKPRSRNSVWRVASKTKRVARRSEPRTLRSGVVLPFRSARRRGRSHRSSVCAVSASIPFQENGRDQGMTYSRLNPRRASMAQEPAMDALHCRLRGVWMNTKPKAKTSCRRHDQVQPAGLAPHQRIPSGRG